MFNQNGGFWPGSSPGYPGVMVLNPTQLDTAQAAQYNGYNVAIWEDDDGPCQIRQKDTDDYFKNAVNGTAALVQGAVAILVQRDPNRNPQYGTAAGSFGTALNELYELFRGGDDYIGLLIDKQYTAYAGYWPESTHIIFQQTNQNGRARLEARTQ